MIDRIYCDRNYCVNYSCDECPVMLQDKENLTIYEQAIQNVEAIKNFLDKQERKGIYEK